jgi:hypothetical protein
MRRRSFLAAFAAATFLAFAGPAVAADATEPQAILKDIYGAYGPDSWPKDPEDRYFSPSLLARYNEIIDGGGDDPSLGIDFDVFINAQDVDKVSDLSLRMDQKTDAMQVVDATFTVFGEEKIIRFTFIKTDAGWKIDDMDWGEEGANLRGLLDQLEADQKAAAEGGTVDEGEDESGEEEGGD